jgi:hypothetical protein
MTGHGTSTISERIHGNLLVKAVDRLPESADGTGASLRVILGDPAEQVMSIASEGRLSFD